MNPRHDEFAALYSTDNMANYSAGRPPSASRTYGQLARQTSRNFADNAYDASYHHPPFQHSQRNFESITPSSLQFPYESSPWNNSLVNGMQQAQNGMHSLGNPVGMGIGMGIGMGPPTMGSGSTSRRPQSRRNHLPTAWTEQQQPIYERDNTLQTFSPAKSGDSEEDLIPTAIVIKNIPFAVKKEQLTEIMANNNLPLPYAFNYHFDAGIFRGLAFANFSTADETAVVIDFMNHMEIQGRKLRVEYKKMLPQRERERIEREKRERRGQLEEQHRPMDHGNHNNNPMLHSQPSLQSLTPNLTPNTSIPTTSPSPVSVRGAPMEEDLDMNDQTTLSYYTQIMMFMGNESREVLVFPPHLPPKERLLIHTIAHKYNLEHKSRGQGDHRQVVVSKIREIDNTSPPQPPMPVINSYSNDLARRGLYRAATTDFSATRGDGPDFHTLERQGSYLEIPNSPSNGFGGSSRWKVREAKSFADLRSHSGSPSLMTSGNIPPVPSLANGLPTGRSPTPNTLTTPTSSNGTHADILGPMNALGLGGYGNERPGVNRSNGRLNMERDNHVATAGAIGSHRQTNGSHEERPNSKLALARPKQTASLIGMHH